MRKALVELLQLLAVVRYRLLTLQLLRSMRQGLRLSDMWSMAGLWWDLHLLWLLLHMYLLWLWCGLRMRLRRLLLGFRLLRSRPRSHLRRLNRSSRRSLLRLKLSYLGLCFLKLFLQHLKLGHGIVRRLTCGFGGIGGWALVLAVGWLRVEAHPFLVVTGRTGRSYAIALRMSAPTT